MLVREMSPEERRSLLEKLLSREEATLPHPPEKEEEVLPDFKAIFKTYSWWTQLLLYLKSLFSGVSLEKVIEERLYADLGRQLQQRFPNWLNYRTRMFFPHFYYELKRLLDAFEVFEDPLILAMGKDKAEFYAFLIGNAIEEIQQRILLETDFWLVYEQNQERTTNEIRSIVEGNLRVILDSIPQDVRKKVYQEVKKAHILYMLATFPREDLLGPFFIDNLGPNTTPFESLADSLVGLWSRLAALDDQDLLTVLESLWMYYLKARGIKRDEWEQELDHRIEKTKESLEIVRDFRTRVPLGKFCALVTKNLEIRKQPLPGVEDWFNIYKNFWKEKIARDFKAFNRERTQRILTSTIIHFLGVTEEEFEENRVYPKFFRNEIYPYQDKTLTFLKLFYQRVFPYRFHTLLKMIFIEGEFYKKANKAEFNETFTQMLRFGEEVEKLCAKISLQGEWGSKLNRIGEYDRERQITEVKSVYQTAADAVADLVKKMTPVLQSLYNLLHGIVKNESGGPYDTLSNLSQLGGKNNSLVRKELVTLTNRADLLLKIVLQLAEVETP